MARGRLIIGVILAVGTLTSCGKKDKGTSAVDPVAMMANLHCEAVQLRKARFELADRMRFIQDTLMLHTTSDSLKLSLQEQLDELEPYKDSIVTRSLDLAKVIKFKLDSLIEQELEQGTERKTFDEKLTAKLKELGCE
ncbi:MAG: hypothetical protein EP314_07930 [Bacteroidetes bacterium]|nr:MAG: hypothetical protein EP314_07930 [Bacteroidota bacterium]